MTLTIATSQFDTSADPATNAQAMMQQVSEAKAAGADIIHFPEACLSGYAGHDLVSYEGYDWVALRRATNDLVDHIRQTRIWVAFGSAHLLSPGHKPHNSVYVINDHGELVDRYDKRFCAGAADGRTGDLAHYTPGNHGCLFSLKGRRIGILICHEYRYPELYREYKRQGADLLLHSFHAGNLSSERFAAMEAVVGAGHHALNPATTIAGITQLAAVPAAAADNYLWISCANSSAPRSCWGAFMARPDGVVTGRLPVEQAGLLITTIDPATAYYDSTRDWRERAMNGQLHSGRLLDDPRSKNRTSF